MNSNSSKNQLSIAAWLPDNCPYLQRFLPRKAKQRPLRLGDKVALITDDLAFAWNLACSYFEAGSPMPARLCYHVAYRVYRYLINRATIPDMDLAMAYAVQEHAGQRDLWRALLVSGASFRQIAAWLEQKVEVVQLFSLVFWNVSPWLKDGAYMAHLLCLNMLEAPDPGIALAQLAYLEGPLRLAREVGLPCVASGAESLAELYDRLERGVLLRANSVISRRSFSPQLRSTIRDGQALLLGRKKSATQAVDDDMRRGLGGMSISMAVNEDVQKIFEGDVNRRVALQLGQATQQAREVQAKKASEQKSTSS